RHTRFSRDWSSDVCSSDLSTRFCWVPVACCIRKTGSERCLTPKLRHAQVLARQSAVDRCVLRPYDQRIYVASDCKECPSRESLEIGRASCRERVEIEDVAG